MAHTVLGSVSIGYQLLWSRLRQLSGVRLLVGVPEAGGADARHLLHALDDLWSEQAPTLLLAVQSATLLADLLAQAVPEGPWIEVHDAHLHDPAMAQRVHQAHQRGLQLVWRGEPGARPSAPLAPCFSRQLIGLTAGEALTCLRVSLRKHSGGDANPASPVTSPVKAGQIYDAVASAVLAEHCLDQQAAWGVADWPMEDVLHRYRHRRIQPGHRTVVRLIEAIDADDANEHIEHILGEDPILAYRFLRYTNSAGLGLRTPIESLRHGLMVLGLAQARAWLLEQLPHATSDLNLHPVRSAMVVRARVMESLLDAGEGEDLRRDVYLCGLMSQIDLLLGEPLADALARLPLSDHITSTLVSQDGPYLAYLAMALAMESGDTLAVRELCAGSQMDLEAVNHNLLRALSRAKPHPARGLLLV